MLRPKCFKMYVQNSTDQTQNTTALANNILQRYIKLKEQGTPDNDPELQRVRQMLTQISQHQKKLRDDYARRQASAQIQQAQNGVNGANGNDKFLQGRSLLLLTIFVQVLPQMEMLLYQTQMVLKQLISSPKVLQRRSRYQTASQPNRWQYFAHSLSLSNGCQKAYRCPPISNSPSDYRNSLNDHRYRLKNLQYLQAIELIV